jgi:hypothetical protein
VKTGRPHARHRPTIPPREPSRLRQTAREDRACTASAVFEVLWGSLADVIGPTATAALIQRSVKRASADQPELHDVVIARDRFVYTYSLPTSWSQTADAPTSALKQVLRHLWPLLSELTGSVVVRRLEQDPFLRRCGVIPEDAAP